MKRHKKSINALSFIQGLFVIFYAGCIVITYIDKLPFYHYILETISFIAVFSLSCIVKTLLCRFAALSTMLVSKNIIDNNNVIENEERFAFIVNNNGQSYNSCQNCGAQVVQNETTCKCCGAPIKSSSSSSCNKD